MRTMLAVLLAIAALAGGAAAQDYPQLRLRYASHVPGTNVVSEADRFFVEEVRRRSGGRVNIDIYWNRAVARQSEVIPLLQAGAIDFTTLETAQYGETPLMGFANALPVTHFDASRLIDLSRALYQQSAGIQGELRRIGARMLFVRHLPNYMLLCRRPFRTLDELSGARLRSYGAYVPVMWRALGANAVNVVASELYDGLEKGTFDCAYLPPPFLLDYRLHEVARYLLDIPFGMIEFAPLLVSERRWTSWPPAVQQLLTEVGQETERFALRKIEEESDAIVQRMIREGAQLVAFEDRDALRQRIPDMLDVWLARQREQGRARQAEEIVGIARARIGTN